MKRAYLFESKLEYERYETRRRIASELETITNSSTACPQGESEFVFVQGASGLWEPESSRPENLNTCSPLPVSLT